MRRAFNIAVFVLIACVIGDRALMHAQAGEKGAISCKEGAERVRLNALSRGFPQAAAGSQGENFLSGCLVTGAGRVGGQIARN